MKNPMISKAHKPPLAGVPTNLPGFAETGAFDRFFQQAAKGVEVTDIVDRGWAHNQL
jgi:hypothetical protein